MKLSTIVFVAATICSAALFVALGFWQLDRRQQRRARNADVAAHIHLPPVSVRTLEGDTAGNRFRRLTIAGRPDFDRDIALTFRGNAGSPGVDILTPVLLRGQDSAVLVNRGWVYSPDGMSADLSKWREQDTTWAGYLEEFEPGSATDSVRQNGTRQMSYAAIARVLPYPIRKFYLVVMPDSASRNATGVVRLNPPPMDEGPHLSYAIQWFSFAAIALVGAGLIVVRRPRT